MRESLAILDREGVLEILCHFSSMTADSGEDDHRFRCEGDHSIQVKTTTYSRARRPLAGAM
jgi:hypothetical protein